MSSGMYHRLEMEDGHHEVPFQRHYLLSYTQKRFLGADAADMTYLAPVRWSPKWFCAPKEMGLAISPKTLSFGENGRDPGARAGVGAGAPHAAKISSHFGAPLPRETRLSALAHAHLPVPSSVALCRFFSINSPLTFHRTHAGLLATRQAA